MDLETLKGKAQRLLELHHGPRILVIVNAWDAASARIVEDAGFPALATTSAGVANALGYPDGEVISRDEMLAAVERVARAVSVPLSADVEAGYGPEPEAVAETARGVLEAGAVGINLEDSTAEPSQLFDLALQVERVRAARAAADRLGVQLVINARTDVYLANVGEPATRFDRAVHRANAYREAGADCLFVPGVADADTIGRLARSIRGPINILAGPAAPPVPELEKLGVARVSLGSGPMRATMALTRRIARELLEHGTYSGFTENTLTYADANRLFIKRGVGEG